MKWGMHSREGTQSTNTRRRRVDGVVGCSSRVLSGIVCHTF